VAVVTYTWRGRFESDSLIDTIVTGRLRRGGIATTLVHHATEHSRAAGCEWLHVDFDSHLQGFYWEACSFTRTDAGVIAL
jgi:hypothetical protein